MEESILLNMQKIVLKEVEIISKITKVDVEVVDSNLYRIAGTGLYSTDINKDMSSKGYVYKHVIETGEKQITFNPGEGQLCIECPDKYNCKESFEVATPIKINDKVIGVIGMVCTDNNQKELLQQNLSVYLEFLDQTADFIAMKAYVELENIRNIDINKILDTVINKISEGVIIIGKNKTICNMNDQAKKQLKLIGVNLGKSISVNETCKISNKNKEYKLEIEEKSYIIIGDVLTISSRIGDMYSILIFNNKNLVKSNSKNITHLKELEKIEIFKAINFYGNTVNGKAEAAKSLGIGIATLYRKLEKYQ